VTRRLVLLLLALGLCQIVYAQIHCALETTDCSEGSCELCHLSDGAPPTPGAATLSSPTLSPRLAPIWRPFAPAKPPSRRSRGRAPPR